MLSRWPIRNKLLLGLTLLLIIMVTMSTSSFQGTYAYRELARSISSRARELPLATALSEQVSNLRVWLADLEVMGLYPHLELPTPVSESKLSDSFRQEFSQAQATVQDYDSALNDSALKDSAHSEFRIGNRSQEFEALAQVKRLLADIEKDTAADHWYHDGDACQTPYVKSDLEQLQWLVAKLPSFLQERMQALKDEVRTRYRAWIILTWICAVAATILLSLFIFLCYRWIFRPLRLLVKGSRIVAAGDFNYRIRLESHDEMAELSAAMNDMTTRFRTIRDDLDRQVQLRTQQVVRSEQLASVGFLAAGVAHEINNPLASIALCAESLEGRLLEMCPTSSDQVEVVQRYLKMIQTEAFRCKEITEKLLDFSRLGPAKRQSADLRDLIQGVIDMVRHLGKYQNRNIDFPAGEPVIAPVNAQEIKQVVLNLVTNALDSVEAGGTLTIQLSRKPDFAEMIFADNGCGMTDEVLKHLFEPFFTRKRGGQGTGLGLSIVYRIVSEHGGQIEAASAGPGRGSQFHVTLPLAEAKKSPLENQAHSDPSPAKQPLAA
ncbi:MAG TPA: HAMP domain-containing sensor histidine kinase [Pirellulales bacterium]|nr:HAMP domain-containing sensor histidine kinase [Pirellulales bacterium]